MLVSEDDINSTLDKASDVANGDDGSRYPGMSYEDGIRDALTWVLTGDENPMED